MWRVMGIGAILAVVVFGELAAVIWAKGGFAPIAAWLGEAQLWVQNGLAGAIRRLRAGQGGALAGFLGLCLAYGVLHAAGPGHGKMVIGGYGLARRIAARRLALLALVSSLAQGVVAVALVYAVVAVLGLSRQVAGDWVTEVMEPLGHAAIAALGLYLVWRGARALRGRGHDHHQHHHHDHDHDHGPDCGCGHAHGPSIAQVQAVQNLREMAVLVAGIALRPCTGAVFVLILTWQLGLEWVGIAGAMTMALGTALFTGGVALAAVTAREGAFFAMGLGRAARLLPWAEVAIGAIIALIAARALAPVLVRAIGLGG